MKTQALGCFIPARLGSKRVPMKNLRPLAGLPLLAHSIRAAKECGLFERIFVCTESPEIAEVAVAHGAEVPGLVPEDLCGDLVPSWKPCVHMADLLAAEEGVSFEDLLCLQPTSPLRSSEDIQRSVEVFYEEDASMLLSVTEIDPHFFHWALAQEDAWGMVFGSDYLLERPLLPKRYRPNGSIKMANIEALRAHGNFFGEGLSCVKTPEERSVHIGSELDFAFCDFLAGRADGR